MRLVTEEVWNLALSSWQGSELLRRRGTSFKQEKKHDVMTPWKKQPTHPVIVMWDLSAE